MNRQEKPFTLVKYFSYISFVVIFGGTIVLFVLNSHLAKTLQQAKSEEYAKLLVENVNHHIFGKFISPTVEKYGRIQLRNKDQYALIDKIVRSTLHGFNVEMVNIYGTDDTISYSYEKENLGKQHAGGTGYLRALKGEASHLLHQRSGSGWNLVLGFAKDSRLVTFAPLRATYDVQLDSGISVRYGAVLGVIEIVQDVSENYKTIFNFQIWSILAGFLVTGVLFFILISVVRRGEAIIEKRHEEELRLREQLSQAERLSALGEMVAGISHEIRNPLGIIRSSAELLKKKHAGDGGSNGGSGGGSDAIPDIIVSEASRLNDIISDFLNFARPLAPEPVPCNVAEVIERNIVFLQPQLEKDHYQVEKLYKNNHIPEVAADPALLYQAFLNIMINAMQAMPGGGRLLLNINASRTHVSVFFEDEGSGIGPEVMTKIWDPFFTTKETGTGLGLGIVKNIVESHGGIIAIENRMVKGTRVIVRLPIKNEG